MFVFHVAPLTSISHHESNTHNEFNSWDKGGARRTQKSITCRLPLALQAIQLAGRVGNTQTDTTYSLLLIAKDGAAKPTLSALDAALAAALRVGLHLVHVDLTH